MLSQLDRLLDVDAPKLPEDEALNILGMVIDLSGDLDNGIGTDKALKWCDEIETSEISLHNRCLVDYYRSNCWANRQQKRHLGRAAAWSWEQPEIEKQIFYLRRAVSREGFLSLNKLRQCQILNNLANQLNSIGRFVEALEIWSNVLALEPKFGVSLGNRGCGYIHYAMAFYDREKTYPFLGFAHLDLTTALSDEAIYLGEDKHAHTHFKNSLNWIESGFELKSDIVNVRTLIEYELGDTDEEKRYRKWCLDNILFLNPLNDIRPHSVAAVDSLIQPPIISSIHDLYPPPTIGFFSQIKQEFVTARWMYYHGITSDELHFSDKDVTLLNTLDYPVYSYANEHVKCSFRITYSILDKIAFLLNHYLSLGIKEHKVSFRSIWYSDKQNRIVNDFFERSENWPLRGLFWLSKDIYEPEFQDVLKENAKELSNIRNFLEHKYLRIHQFEFSGIDPKDDCVSLGRLISRSELEDKALQMLKLVRAALIYLSLGLHAEELKRKGTLGEGFIMPMDVETLDEEWKI